jgi:hypothetical protein
MLDHKRVYVEIIDERLIMDVYNHLMENMVELNIVRNNLLKNDEIN